MLRAQCVLQSWNSNSCRWTNVSQRFRGANLDGIVNVDDYTQLDSSVSAGGALKGYFNGDFNYDGNVDIDDYTIIDSNIGTQGAPL